MLVCRGCSGVVVGCVWALTKIGTARMGCGEALLAERYPVAEQREKCGLETGELIAN